MNDPVIHVGVHVDADTPLAVRDHTAAAGSVAVQIGEGVRAVTVHVRSHDDATRLVKVCEEAASLLLAADAPDGGGLAAGDRVRVVGNGAWRDDSAPIHGLPVGSEALVLKVDASEPGIHSVRGFHPEVGVVHQYVADEHLERLPTKAGAA